MLEFFKSPFDMSDILHLGPKPDAPALQTKEFFAHFQQEFALSEVVSWQEGLQNKPVQPDNLSIHNT